MLFLRDSPTLLVCQLLCLKFAMAKSYIDDPGEPTTVFRFPGVSFWNNLTVTRESVVDGTTFATMTNEFQNGNAHGQEQFEITDANTSYILKYSITDSGTSTITTEQNCLASINALTSCVSTSVNIPQGANPTTTSSSIELLAPLVLIHYLIDKSSRLTPSFTTRTLDDVDTKPTTTSSQNDAVEKRGNVVIVSIIITIVIQFMG